MPTAKKPKPAPGPDDLVRQEAGNYMSGDGRFEVRQSDANWYVVDREQSNEFGQELIHGPYGSMKDAKTSLAGARDITPLLRSRVRPKPAPSKKVSDKGRAEPKAPPPSWIDRLPKSDQVEVRSLIRALGQQGVADAEALVRKDRQGLLPVVAATLMNKRLDELVGKLPEKDRAGARKLIDQLGAVITSGEKLPDPLPGWALFETGQGREPTKRRIRVGR